jgi:hypothetical protein
MGFVVDKAALGQVFSEYFGFPCQSFHQFFSTIIITRGWHNRPTGGRSAEWTQLDSTPYYTNLKKITEVKEENSTKLQFFQKQSFCYLSSIIAFHLTQFLTDTMLALLWHEM